jgi:hypothetical protein
MPTKPDSSGEFAAAHAPATPTRNSPNPPPGLLERIRASLAGTVRVAPGVDLTAPTWEL